ncbi:hypothetical protein CEXT_261481 [Caerostris extrusa]|uniref:Uncharacterized protein n=1 Tax=Caerostris extrusa TaxID=172846 RepID=A0AAV4QV35_CAEEX|nr:hypothetical protein CEXT_261481 [Caerostris extrusa]
MIRTRTNTSAEKQRVFRQLITLRNKKEGRLMRAAPYLCTAHTTRPPSLFSGDKTLRLRIVKWEKFITRSQLHDPRLTGYKGFPAVKRTFSGRTMRGRIQGKKTIPFSCAWKFQLRSEDVAKITRCSLS